ncbi:heme ABC transporter ATP-binding protein [Marinobacter xestospongiae]|uniref:Heme ABC transporter ATP-binding protein n=1 Tax=Marinobacter xestospongiae TaxID=994319 RepID=A0ABU3W1C7_9GAMM|nr:heme ABC transporter ATP-binding protein [Marinobacter xestospongiae]MDV2080325.1 heme ABC transporter ATP-binding protein [Marinobacter xestospongiae]
MVFDVGRVLQIDDVSLSLGGKTILSQASLSLQRGELLALLGPNGAGKSSLLKVASGDLALQNGRVHVAGKRLQVWRRPELARHRAVMPQRVEVNFPFTAREIVALGCCRGSPEERNELIEHLLRRLEVSALADRLISTLSGGEQQRVQLARVLAQLWHSSGPRLLLLDECTSALDPAQQQLVFGLLRELASDQGYAILAVVHDLNLAAAYADRLVVMSRGQTRIDGSPGDVLTPAMLERVYGLRARVEQLPEGYPMVVPLGTSGASFAPMAAAMGAG